MITPDLVCRSCSSELDSSRVQLGLYTCIKCSDTEKYSAHIVYPHKTGAIVQPVQEDTKRNIQRLDRRSSNGGRTAKGIFADNSWDRWLDNYYNSYIYKTKPTKKISLKNFQKISHMENNKLQDLILKNFIELGDAKGAARTYNNMGYLLRRKNDRTKALESYGEVETILEENDDIELISAQLILARSFLDLGETERARKHALDAFEKSDNSENQQIHARAQAVLGRYHAKIGDLDVASHHYSNALEAMGEEGDILSMLDITIFTMLIRLRKKLS